MKQLTKLAVLSLALIASIFVLNHTNAAGSSGAVLLQLNAGVATCTYGTSLDLGAAGVAYTTFSITGNDFSPSTWYCEDIEGLEPWAMSVQLTNDLTNQYNQSIPTGNVLMYSSNNYVMSGTCTPWTNDTSNRVAIDVSRSILTKSSATWEICTIATSWVNLAVVIPSNQSVGIYTGELTVTLPNGF